MDPPAPLSWFKRVKGGAVPIMGAMKAWLSLCQHNGSVNGINDAEDAPKKLPSLDFILEETKRVSLNLDRTMSLLDSKSNFQLGSSTVLMAIVTLVSNTTGTPSPLANLLARSIRDYTGWNLNSTRLISIALGASMLLFVAFLISSFMGYRLRRIVDTPRPTALQSGYMTCEEVVTKAAVQVSLACTYEKNYCQVKRKQRWVGLAHSFVLFQGVSLVITLMLAWNWR